MIVIADGRQNVYVSRDREFVILLRSYSYITATVTLADDSPTARGGISYLMNDVLSIVLCLCLC